MLTKILSDLNIKKTLALVFDIDIIDDEDLWFRVQSEELFRPIAKEGAGGIFLVGEQTGVILYVSSEGQAGIIAKSFPALIQLVIAHPYWISLLGASSGADTFKMRNYVSALEHELQDFEPKIDKIRNMLYKKLQLQAAEFPINDLYYAVRNLGKTVKVLGREGDDEEYEPLF
jgi:hypothetical protein